MPFIHSLTCECMKRILLVVGLCAAASSQAVTFDCAKANGPDENAICSEVALSKLDDEFGNGVRMVNANLSIPLRDYFKRAQERWAASPASPRSGACKGDVKCITARYQERLAYLRNPHLPFEGVYAAKKVQFRLESFASGALRYGFYPEGGGAAVYFNEGREPRVSHRELLAPPPAEHCALRLEFAQDGNLTVYVKEAKKKACDNFKLLAGVYVRDYARVPVN